LEGNYINIAIKQLYLSEALINLLIDFIVVRFIETFKIMIFHDEILTPVELYINPDYENSITNCQINNDVEFSLKRHNGDNVININFKVVFSAIQEDETVVRAVFDIISKFEKANKNHLLIIDDFLVGVYLNVQNYLKDHIPTGMILPTNHLISDYEIGLLRDGVFSELKALGFCS
jgi:hypothetical protein